MCEAVSGAFTYRRLTRHHGALVLMMTSVKGEGDVCLFQTSNRSQLKSPFSLDYRLIAVDVGAASCYIHSDKYTMSSG